MDLSPFVSMLATMTDAEIAAAAGATVEAVAAFRAQQAAPTAEVAPRKGRKAAETPAPPEPAPTAEVESAPACVRVVKPARGVRLPGAPPGRGLQFRDIYNGEAAAWLWQNMRDHVEIFPGA